jgi:hypothetical protein
LQRHQSDGTFYTHAPTDIWELLHHHLSLATSTASPILSFLVANAIVEELNVIIRKTTAYVQQMHQTDPSDAPAVYREVELELLCALSNDIALHFEQVQTVIEKFNIEEIRLVDRNSLEFLSFCFFFIIYLYLLNMFFCSSKFNFFIFVTIFFGHSRKYNFNIFSY